MWQLPTGLSADKNVNNIERMKHYRFIQQHFLKDGTRVVPTIETMRHVFDAYNMFELPIVVSANSYTLYVKDNE